MIRSHLRRLLAAVIVPVCFCLPSAATAQHYSLTAHRNTSLTPGSNGFYESLPEGYNVSGKSYPLLVVFHGSGDNGDGQGELDRVLQLGIGKRLLEGTLPDSFKASNDAWYQFIVIMPQFSTDAGDGASINRIIDECISRYRVLSNRIYITGCSIGARRAWETAGASDASVQRIAAIIPMATPVYYVPQFGPVITSNHLPVWAFHNQNDNISGVELTHSWIDQLNTFNPNPAPRLTIFNAFGHDVWTQATDPAYREGSRNIYEWMLSYSRGLDPLPVTFTSFTATRASQGIAATLGWATGYENNNNYFSVERSANGTDFISIGKIYSTNPETGTSYTFTDQQPVSGTNYYRIAQVDLDGTTTYSAVRSLDFAATGAFVNVTLYPNPATTQLSIDFSDSYTGRLTVRIISAAGVTVLQENFTKSASRFSGSVSLQGITSGYYFLEVSSGTNLSRVPFLKK